MFLLKVHDDLGGKDGIAGIAAFIDGGEFEDDRIILRIALVQIFGPAQRKLELSLLLVRELRDRAAYCIRAGGAVGESMLVQAVADGYKSAFAEIRGFGLEVQDDIQATVGRNHGIDGFYLEGRLGIAV